MHASGHPIWVALSLACVRDELGRPLEYVIQVQDATERERLQERLRFESEHDPLTGLLNRRAFERELRNHAEISLESTSRASRSARPRRWSSPSGC